MRPLPATRDPGAPNYGVGAGESPPGDGEGASTDPSVFGGFLFAAPALLCRARGDGLGDA
jgi:hypothetical protein